MDQIPIYFPPDTKWMGTNSAVEELPLALKACSEAGYGVFALIPDFDDEGCLGYWIVLYQKQKKPSRLIIPKPDFGDLN